MTHANPQKLVTVAPDRGCQYAPRCVTCPWARCIKELPAAERAEFRAALRLVGQYLPAAPDQALE